MASRLRRRTKEEETVSRDQLSGEYFAAPTRDQIAQIAISRYGAPADLATYPVWLEAEQFGETFGGVQATDGTHIPLDHSDTTTYGTLRIGWDAETRRVAWSWTPNRR
jgi:hypothetical protein